MNVQKMKKKEGKKEKEEKKCSVPFQTKKRRVQNP